ncbi:MAG: AAA family ATPase [Candidatus Asgardarchaeia archaeon]
MILKKLYMKDFLSHKSTEIEFDKGVTVISGPNGAGKSSILEAIGFALFKETATRGNIGDLIRYGCGRMVVSLEFYHNGSLYKIERTNFRNSSPEYRLYKDGKLVALSGRKESNIEYEIRQILGMDPELFKQSIYIRQGEIASLVRAQPHQRKRIISRLLGIDALENAHKNMYSLIKEFERRLEEKREKKEKLSEKEEELKNLKEELKDREEDYRKKEEEISEADKRLKEIEKLLEEFDLKRKEYEELKTRIEMLSKSIEELEGELYDKERELSEIGEIREKIEIMEPIRDLKDSLSEIRGYLNRREPLKNRLIEIRGEIEKIKSNIEEKVLNLSRRGYDTSDIGRLIETLRRDEVELESKIDKLNEEKREIESEMERLNFEKEDVEKKKIMIEGSESRCPLCGQILTEEHRQKLLIEHGKKLDEVESKIESLKRTLREREVMIDDLMGKLEFIEGIKIELLERDYETLMEKRREFEEQAKNVKEIDEHILSYIGRMRKLIDGKVEIARVKDELFYEIYSSLEEVFSTKDLEKLSIGLIKRIESKLDEGMNYYDELRRKLAQLDRISKEIEEIKRKVSRMRGDKRKLEERLKEVSYNEEEHLRLKEKRDFELENLRNLREERGGLAREIEVKKSWMKSLEKEIEEIRKEVEEIPAMERLIKILKDIREKFGKDGIQKILRERARPAIERAAKVIFSEFNLDYTDITIKDDYDVILRKPSAEVKIDQISGGELIAIALAIRLAIAKAFIRNIELIMLDEPTIHLDEQRIESLVEILKRKIVPQTIVVTHEDTLKMAADNLIEVRNEGGVSIVEVKRS